MKLVAIISLGVFAVTAPQTRAASLNYANSSGATFSFSQMSEYSFLDTFIGSIPGNTPQVMTDSRGDYLNWIPSTVLDAAAGGSKTSAYATSRFSSVISGKNSSNVAIPGLEIVFDLRTNISPNPTSTVDFSASLFLQIFGVNGNESSIPRTFKKTLFPTDLSGSWTSSNASHQGWQDWTLVYTIADLEAEFQNAGFVPSTMNITKLGLSLTPEISVETSGAGSAAFYMDQMTIAVIPEPTSATLFVFGSSLLLLRRRKARSSS